MRRSLPDRREQGGDQRLITFLLLSLSILMFSQLMGGPDPPPPKANDQAAGAGDNKEGGEVQGDKLGQAAAEQGDTPPEGAEAAAPLEEGPEASPQLVSIGSAQIDGPNRLLLTLTNTGAAIQRTELSARKFRDLDDRSGYLGELGLVDGENGIEITVVGAGTPAAEAGLEVGDKIQAVSTSYVKSEDSDVLPEGEEPTDAAELREWLADSKPGEKWLIFAGRDGGQIPLEATLTRRPLMLIRPESENLRLHNPDLAKDFKDVPSFLVTIDELNEAEADDPAVAKANKRLTEETWEVTQADGQSATFRKRLAGVGLAFEKRFSLVKTPEDKLNDRSHPGYHFELDVTVRNLLSKPQAVAYKIDGPNGLPIEGWWYSNRIGRKESGAGAWSAVGIRDVVARYRGSDYIQWRCSKIADGKAKPMGQGASMAFLGVDAKYFSVVMMPKKENPEDVWFSQAEARLATPKLEKRDALPTYNNTTFSATRKSVNLGPAGEDEDSLEDGFRVFAGPKRPELLVSYQPFSEEPRYGLDNLLYYGWFGPIARLMLEVLHFFYGFVQNYGVAIILLTVLVRGCMFPISRRQAQNMTKMQELKPEMDRIAEKYKDNMEKRAKAQQELYRKHNFNPLGGCLPMFIQLPIFIGLYRALAVDIELRQAPLFSEGIRFCSNLAAPDMLIDWSGMWWRTFNNGQGMLYLGPFFNILPIATIVLFLLQQKMFMPPPANEQAELQQKMMKYMMVFFGLMFFKVPSGLCIYFIASSLWGIAERKLLPKPTPASDEGFSKPKTSESKSNPKPKPNSGKNAKRKKKKR